MTTRAEINLDEAARKLDRARASTARRPDDLRAQLGHAEALAAYEAARADLEAARVADLTTRNMALRRGLRQALAAISERQAFIDRYGALAPPRTRRQPVRDECAPLLALLDGAAQEGRVA